MSMTMEFPGTSSAADSAEGAAASPADAAAEAREQVAAQLRRRAVRGGVLLIITRLLTQIFVWAGTLLTARYLDPYDFGIMGLGLLLVELADLLAEAGVGKALIQKEKLEPRDLRESFAITCLIAVVLYGLLWFLAEPVAVWYGRPEFPPFLRILALHVLFSPFLAIPLALLDRSLSMGKQSAIHVLAAVIQSATVLGLAIAGWGYWALVVGSLGRRFLEVVAFSLASGWRPIPAMPGKRAIGFLSFGIHISVGTLLWFLYSNVDRGFVAKFSGLIEAGLYTMAFTLVTMPAEKLTGNVNKIAYPTFCRLQQDPERLRDWFLRLLVLIGFLGMPVMVGMALVAEDGLVVVLGEKWRDATLPFQLLSLAGLFKVYSVLFPMLYTAVGRPDINLKFNAACVVLFPLGFFLAGSNWGTIGVCLVWMVLYPVVVAIMISLTRNLAGIGLNDLLRSQARIAAGVAIMAALVLATQWLMQDADAPLRLCAAVAVGMVSYTGLMWLLCRATVLADVGRLWRELRG
ncbi:MAG: lipopolysaccharide biosynthesis protein [Gemmataceae bacterium]|nr:lipopolysaccharide biosynthesis protein [Gemmataceae bacterium]MCI0739340.1 lipopolysaccharide biosynthesis protein [Gemmataceae bacterium]